MFGVVRNVLGCDKMLWVVTKKSGSEKLPHGLNGVSHGTKVHPVWTQVNPIQGKV